MKKQVVVWLLFFVARTSYAGDCPVTIHKLANSATFRNLIVEYENTSAKEIKAVKFSAIFFDDVNDPHDAVYDYTADKKLKPGKKTSKFWDVALFAGYRVQLHVKKVLYTDGQEWVNDSVKACTWNEVRK